MPLPNHERRTKNNLTPAGTEPTVARSTSADVDSRADPDAVVLGLVYFDRHSGWFDAQVYSPYPRRSNAGIVSAQVRRGGGAGAGQKSL